MHSPGGVEQGLAGLSCRVSKPLTVLDSRNSLRSASAQPTQRRCKVGTAQALLNTPLVRHTPPQNAEKAKHGPVT